MSFWNFYAANRPKMNMYNMARDWITRDVQPYFEKVIGYTQYKNTQESLQAQMDYDQYLKAANERALADWHKNVPNREIKYPELSYAGQIRRADTSIARAGLDYDTAYSNFIGNLAYRSAGLYNVPTGLYRSL